MNWTSYWLYYKLLVLEAHAQCMALSTVHQASLWATAAAVVAVYLESIYKTMSGTFLQNLWYIGPLQLLVSYCLYRVIVTPNLTLIDAFVIWGMMTMALRTAVTVAVLHETVQAGTWFALALMILARISQSYWRT